MNPFKDKTIEKRMMSLVKQVITDAQKAYEFAIAEADKAIDAKIQSIVDEHESSKVELADKMVKEAFSKLK